MACDAAAPKCVSCHPPPKTQKNNNNCGLLLVPNFLQTLVVMRERTLSCIVYRSSSECYREVMSKRRLDDCNSLWTRVSEVMSNVTAYQFYCQLKYSKRRQLMMYVYTTLSSTTILLQYNNNNNKQQQQATTTV